MVFQSILCVPCVFGTYRPSHRPIVRSYIYYDDLKHISTTHSHFWSILIQSICANLNVEMWQKNEWTHLAFTIDAMYAHDETLSFITSSNSFYSAYVFFSHASMGSVHFQCAIHAIHNSFSSFFSLSLSPLCQILRYIHILKAHAMCAPWLYYIQLWVFFRSLNFHYIKFCANVSEIG